MLGYRRLKNFTTISNITIYKKKGVLIDSLVLFSQYNLLMSTQAMKSPSIEGLICYFATHPVLSIPDSFKYLTAPAVPFIFTTDEPTEPI